MQKTCILVPKFDLYNKNLDRGAFLNQTKELRPEGYAADKVKDKLSRIKSFNIRKQLNRDMKM